MASLPLKPAHLARRMKQPKLKKTNQSTNSSPSPSLLVAKPPPSADNLLITILPPPPPPPPVDNPLVTKPPLPVDNLSVAKPLLPAANLSPLVANPSSLLVADPSPTTSNSILEEEILDGQSYISVKSKRVELSSLVSS
jgi:hypothetical protein